jgi:hypothetical protein
MKIRKQLTMRSLIDGASSWAPAAGLAGLAVQARAYLSEYEVEFAEGEGEGEGELDFSRIGAVLANGILAVAGPDSWRNVNKAGRAGGVKKGPA